MQKDIITLRAAEADETWCTKVRNDVAAGVRDIGPHALAVNVRDDAVRDSLMTLTTLTPPVVALVSVWTEQSYGDEVRAATTRLGTECDETAPIWPLPAPDTEPAERTAGLANIALLRRPEALRWHIDHTPVAIETQATFGYARTRWCPIGARSLVSPMTTSRGANRNIDTIPTSWYVFRNPISSGGDPMTTLDDAVALAADENGLAVVSTLRADGTIQASLVNAGALPHPATGQPALAFVTYGKVKLTNLRARPQLAVTFRKGWQWATVEGRAELAGPDDRQPWLTDSEQLRLLLREVFTAAGGTHDDWDEYDRVMAEQRRTVVLVAPNRVYSNGSP